MVSESPKGERSYGEPTRKQLNNIRKQEIVSKILVYQFTQNGILLNYIGRPLFSCMISR
jgi:hypothetical protein